MPSHARQSGRRCCTLLRRTWPTAPFSLEHLPDLEPRAGLVHLIRLTLPGLQIRVEDKLLVEMKRYRLGTALLFGIFLPGAGKLRTLLPRIATPFAGAPFSFPV